MSKINSNKKDLAYPTPKALWNIKILLQGLVVGIIYGIFIYWHLFVYGLAMCEKCVSVVRLVTDPPLYLIEKIAEIFSIVVNRGLRDYVRIASNLIFIWTIFYAIFLKFKINIKTIHLTILSILITLFLALVFVALVTVFMEGLNAAIYSIIFVIACIIFIYTSCVNFRSSPEVTKKEILLIAIYLLSLVLLIAFFYIRLLRILSH